MQGYGGLFELIIVFACVLGFGFVELRSIKRDTAKAKAADEAKRAADQAGDPT